ncbi:MAG: hypothetical protein J2P48_11050 [Alphaproteobacteria bacterium]|nr:hypothetical protein [Alphaproteobacteria bacterium]
MAGLLERALDAVRDLPAAARDGIVGAVPAGARDEAPAPLTRDARAAVSVSKAAVRGELASEVPPSAV